MAATSSLNEEAPRMKLLRELVRGTFARLAVMFRHWTLPSNL